jgi:tripartite-type tricarboxylate transporter receptor subunit TctC
MLVDNRTGAAEIIGTDIVAKANPDGYTLVFVSLRHSVNPSLLKLPYDTRLFQTPTPHLNFFPQYYLSTISYLNFTTTLLLIIPIL